MAFKIAGSMAFKQAMEEADPVLLEPIVRLTVSCPEDVVGDVIGDLNSRRGHPLGMEPKGSATEVRAEVPMAEVLDYAPDLRSISGGRADFAMEFERYEEVPAHLASQGGRRGVPIGCRRRLGFRREHLSRDPAAPGANVGRRRGPCRSAAWSDAVDRFNASDAARTVAGLMRTLGQPRVSVGAAAGSPSEVRITVAWELSWYQWGVDVGDELRPVFRARQGRRARPSSTARRGIWNGGVGEGGRLTSARLRPAPPDARSASAERCA